MIIKSIYIIKKNIFYLIKSVETIHIINYLIKFVKNIFITKLYFIIINSFFIIYKIYESLNICNI